MCEIAGTHDQEIIDDKKFGMSKGEAIVVCINDRYMRTIEFEKGLSIDKWCSIDISLEHYPDVDTAPFGIYECRDDITISEGVYLDPDTFFGFFEDLEELLCCVRIRKYQYMVSR
jgi:hypothetical protein